MKFFFLLLFVCSHLCAGKVGYLDIPRDRPIDSTTLLYVKFALEEYRKEKVQFVVMHLDTPGGEVFAATSIAEALLEIDRLHNIPVVAVIDNWALSAGAMLAYSSRYIAVAPQGIMGAAEPVMANSTGQMESAPEKINSALRKEMATLAKAFDRNPFIAEAMVDKDLLLVKREGKILSVEETKKGDEILSQKGKLLTCDAQELIDWGIANFQLEDPKNLSSLPLFSSVLPLDILHYSSWKIGFFSFLSHPLIASLLMMGLIAGFYLELQHPGTGFFAGIGAICLSLILLSHFSFQTIDWLELIFLVAGGLLILTEVFLLPGTFICGLLGGLLFLVGLFGLLLPSWGHTPFSFNPQEWSLSAIHFVQKLEWLFVSLILSLILILILSRLFTPMLFKKGKIILEQDQTGTVAGLLPNELPSLGNEGIVITPLLPGGKVTIQGKLYDVLSDGPFFDKGAKVVVSEIRGRVIVVSQLR